jgi:hypothetical protein
MIDERLVAILDCITLVQIGRFIDWVIGKVK